MPPTVHTSFGKALAILIIVITGMLLYGSFLEEESKAQLKPRKNQQCKGTPIVVDYPYHGGMIAPHACKPQCATEKQRYILYSNGKATQCQILPGCLDWGEDQGVTCLP